jgi:hypothetical protein
MENKFVFSFLSLVVKKNLFRALVLWKSATKASKVTEKYKKLKQYTSRILKTRHIPCIKIHTPNQKKSGNTENFYLHQADFKNKFNTFSSKVQIYRSTSNKKLTQKPPFFPTTAKLQSKLLSDTSDEENKLRKNSENKILPKSYKTEEIAVVSSSNLLSELKIQNIYTNKNTY